MDAYQYFYDGQDVVGKAPVGTLEFDLRDGHHHWHLQQFAAYRLLTADQTHVAKSRKQSFCIVPTDPIDLSLDAAERRPYTSRARLGLRLLQRAVDPRDAAGRVGRHVLPGEGGAVVQHHEPAQRHATTSPSRRTPPASSSRATRPTT